MFSIRLWVFKVHYVAEVLVGEGFCDERQCAVLVHLKLFIRFLSGGKASRWLSTSVDDAPQLALFELDSDGVFPSVVVISGECHLIFGVQLRVT